MLGGYLRFRDPRAASPTRLASQCAGVPPPAWLDPTFLEVSWGHLDFWDPRAASPTRLASQFLPLRNALQKSHRKKCENQGFWPPKTIPKPIQNAFKIEVPKNIDLFEVFYYSFCICLIFETLKICVFPRENQYFQGFR